jgi:hypothetical protein
MLPTDMVVRYWSYDQHDRRTANWRPRQVQVTDGRPSTFLRPCCSTTQAILLNEAARPDKYIIRPTTIVTKRNHPRCTHKPWQLLQTHDRFCKLVGVTIPSTPSICVDTPRYLLSHPLP